MKLTVNLKPQSLEQCDQMRVHIIYCGASFITFSQDAIYIGHTPYHFI